MVRRAHDQHARSGSRSEGRSPTEVVVWIKPADVTLCFIAPVRAQDDDDYPRRPIHIIVPFPAGGPTDILSRIVGQEMSASWGQAVVIENRPGADTAIGAEVVAKADPDGYTLLAAMDSTMVLNPLMKKDLPYDPLTRLSADLARRQEYLAARGSRRLQRRECARTCSTCSKPNRDKLNFGAGTTNGRLAALLFAKLTNTTFAIIPYKGSADTTQGLLTGSVDFAHRRHRLELSADHRTASFGRSPN